MLIASIYSPCTRCGGGGADEAGHRPPLVVWQPGEAENDQDEEPMGEKGMEWSLE